MKWKSRINFWSKIPIFQLLDKITLHPAILENGELCDKSQVKVEFNAKTFARQTISKCEQELEEFIEQNWIKICQKNPRVYNGSKFRLASLQKCENIFEIQVGITSYKVSCI